MDIDYGKYFPISEYYEKVVMPINKRFKLVKKEKFVCCLHSDTDPSLGIVHSKTKGEMYHCFGCNAWGNVIDLHKKVSLKYFKKNIDDEQAKRELCSIFGVSYKDLPSEVGYDLSKVGNKDVRRELAMREAMDRYNIADFKSDIIRGKIEGKSVSYYNSLVIRMIDEKIREGE